LFRAVLFGGLSRDAGVCSAYGRIFGRWFRLGTLLLCELGADRLEEAAAALMADAGALARAVGHAGCRRDGASLPAGEGIERGGDDQGCRRFVSDTAHLFALFTNQLDKAQSEFALNS